MLEAHNTDYYNVKGIQINDPSINYDDVLENGAMIVSMCSDRSILMCLIAPAVGQLNEQAVIFGLNDTTMAWLNKQNEKCGYAAFMEEALTYPPKGPLPSAPSGAVKNCDLWGYVVSAAIYVNPCCTLLSYRNLLSASSNGLTA